MREEAERVARLEEAAARQRAKEAEVRQCRVVSVLGFRVHTRPSASRAWRRLPRGRAPRRRRRGMSGLCLSEVLGFIQGQGAALDDEARAMGGRHLGCMPLVCYYAFMCCVLFSRPLHASTLRRL